MTQQVKMPEPFTFFHGYRTQDLNGNKDDKPPMPYVGLPLFTTDQAEAYANARMRESLEEAYQSAREVEKKLLADHLQHVSGPAAANYVANRVRALIPQHDNE